MTSFLLYIDHLFLFAFHEHNFIWYPKIFPDNIIYNHIILHITKKISFLYFPYISLVRIMSHSHF